VVSTELEPSRRRRLTPAGAKARPCSALPSQAPDGGGPSPGTSPQPTSTQAFRRRGREQDEAASSPARQVPPQNLESGNESVRAASCSTPMPSGASPRQWLASGGLLPVNAHREIYRTALMAARQGKPTDLTPCRLAGGHRPARKVGRQQPAGGAGDARSAPLDRTRGRPGDGQIPQGGSWNPLRAMRYPARFDRPAMDQVLDEAAAKADLRDQPGKTID